MLKSALRSRLIVSLKGIGIFENLFIPFSGNRLPVEENPKVLTFYKVRIRLCKKTGIPSG